VLRTAPQPRAGEIAPELEARYREAIADGDDSAWLGLAEILALQGRTEAAAECLHEAAQAGITRR
jgi:hypothetical protein